MENFYFSWRVGVGWRVILFIMGPQKYGKHFEIAFNLFHGFAAHLF